MVMHNDNNYYVVNMQALHNSHLLRKIFPDKLYTIPVVVKDRVKFHACKASELRTKSALQKAKTQARCEADKRATNSNV